MPAAYAHSRFGRQVMTTLNADALESVRRFPHLFRVGLQGPDPLFYYNPFRKNRCSKLASVLHRTPGRDIFSGLKPDLQQTAYLYGLLCHYCLDSVCHPYVDSVDASGACGHTELETDFDRFLMERDGIDLPHTRHLGAGLCLSREDCLRVSACFPGVTPDDFRKSLNNMRLATQILSGNTILPRPLLERVLPRLGSVQEHLMPRQPNPRAMGLNEKLLDHYREARERYPALAQELGEYLRHGTPLGDDFALIMG